MKNFPNKRGGILRRVLNEWSDFRGYSRVYGRVPSWEKCAMDIVTNCLLPKGTILSVQWPQAEGILAPSSPAPSLVDPEQSLCQGSLTAKPAVLLRRSSNPTGQSEREWVRPECVLSAPPGPLGSCYSMVLVLCPWPGGRPTLLAECPSSAVWAKPSSRTS